MKAIFQQLLYAVGLILFGASCVIVFGYILVLRSYPDLAPWHEADLETDFRADMQIDTLAGYLEVGARAFAELNQKPLDQIESSERSAFNHRNLRDVLREAADSGEIQPSGRLLLGFSSASATSLTDWSWLSWFGSGRITTP
ncbi:MAG: hypothetical protein GTO41_24320 [Burkholderiales bacterium]|nr:hypothetical protein [Burkholderiales bacterium]